MDARVSQCSVTIGVVAGEGTITEDDEQKGDVSQL